ncbi:MAG: anthranilate phosphoribosyltransferase [Chthoniobacteraceae bacterium]|nr:anthranilate phosphoribosyltransferase [Chthoniobacteraceae bacterium]
MTPLPDLIAALKAGQPLSPQAVEQAAAFLVDPQAGDGLKADFLRALARKGETDDEIAGFAQAFLDRSVNPGLDAAALPGPLLDCCGTGGDKLDLFNVSTTAMFVLAAGGVCVVKHGNRSITSQCGGADVLEALGVRIDLPPADFKRCMETVGCGFMFAPFYHPAFKAIGPVRKALGAEGVPTMFNLLGPILNPARPAFQLVGVFAKAMLPKFGHVLRQLGRTRAWAVHGSAGGGTGMDEVSTLGPTAVCAVDKGCVSSFTVDPAALGIALAPSLASLQGGDKTANARITRDVLGGQPGPKRDLVLLNAAAGFVAAGLENALEAGLARATEALDSGRALGKLQALRDFR